MHDVVVTMKGGRKYCGPLWEYRPKEGHISLVGTDSTGKLRRIWLDNVASAVEKDVRTHPGKVEDVDLLKQAMEDGWKPKPKKEDKKT